MLTEVGQPVFSLVHVDPSRHVQVESAQARVDYSLSIKVVSGPVELSPCRLDSAGPVLSEINPS